MEHGMLSFKIKVMVNFLYLFILYFSILSYIPLRSDLLSDPRELDI